MQTICDSAGAGKLAARRDRKWIPLIWLPYFGFFLLQPVLEHADWKHWLATGIGGVVFLILFFGMFWVSNRKVAWSFLAGMAALGMIMAPLNGGASTFFIYAAAFSPFLAETELGGVAVIVTVAALAAIETWVFHLGGWFLLYAGGFAMAIGAGNIFFAQRNRANAKLRMAKEEIEHLAKVAERERIARDLHDVLGHTLSLIIVKSELAGKLVERHPERAKQDIEDIQRAAREALAEVRSTIRGYRVQSLEAEMDRARAALQTAGVAVEARAEKLALSPAQESVVAMVLREAVTNVVRHAGAHRCSLQLIPLEGNCVLEIADDGCGGSHVEGNGLRGMRERIEALGGTVKRETAQGTRLRIEFPIEASQA